ncbi:MAG: biotin--[acetyl-CoA-carboxylase] ligase [Acidimicrobiales bacterium]
MFLPERVRSELATTTRFADIRVLESVDSTNRYVADEAREGAPEGLVVVADFQAAGRGRLGRTWHAPPGAALLVSILLRPAGLGPGRLHLVSAAAGLAAQAACEETGRFRPELKWPNDLMIGERKLAGILAEVTGDAVVVGVGINVSSAPPGAICAERAAGRPLPRAELLRAMLMALERSYGRWDEVAVAYREACATVGRQVHVELPDGRFDGRAEALDDAGRLRVRRFDGEAVTVVAGDVIHLRTTGPDRE